MAFRNTARNLDRPYEHWANMRDNNETKRIPIIYAIVGRDYLTKNGRQRFGEFSVLS